MSKEKEEFSMKQIMELLNNNYVGEKVLDKIKISKYKLEEAVQEVYHGDTCKHSWFGVDSESVSKLYSKTKIIPKYTSEELTEFDEKMAKSVNHTTGFGIGHEDAGHYVPYSLIKEIIPLKSLPAFKKTVQKCYTQSVNSCSLDLLCLYNATEIKPDFDKIAKETGIKKQKIIDGLYSDAQELSKRWNVDPKLVYEMSGIKPSKNIQEKILENYWRN